MIAKQDLAFKWQIIDIKDKTISIKVEFVQPLTIKSKLVIGLATMKRFDNLEKTTLEQDLSDLIVIKLTA